jgi:hypothetical protein
MLIKFSRRGGGPAGWTAKEVFWAVQYTQKQLIAFSNPGQEQFLSSLPLHQMFLQNKTGL